MISVFDSERIDYIPVSFDLVDDYLVMVNDKEIQRLISKNERVYSREDELNWIKSKLEDKAYVFSMISKEDGSYIGNVELMDVENGSAEVGLCITMGMQNKHYGQEAITTMINYAFNVLGLEQLNAVVFSHNERSLHCLEKYGFVKYKEVKNVKQLNEKEIDDVYLKLNR